VKTLVKVTVKTRMFGEEMISFFNNRLFIQLIQS